MTLVYDNILQFISNNKIKLSEINQPHDIAEYFNLIESNILSNTLITIKNSKIKIYEDCKLINKQTIKIFYDSEDCDEIKYNKSFVNNIIKINGKYYFVQKSTNYNFSHMIDPFESSMSSMSLCGKNIYSKIIIYPDIDTTEYEKTKQSKICVDLIAYLGDVLHQYSSLLQMRHDTSPHKFILNSIVNPSVYSDGEYNEEINFCGLEKCNIYQQKIINSLKYNIEVIHGPPGTGKTCTILNIIKSAIPNNHRIMCTAIQNQAIESIVTKLIDDKNLSNSFVVFGDPTRLKPNSLKYQIDNIFENDEVLQKIKNKIKKYEYAYELNQVINNSDVLAKIEEYELKYSTRKAKILSKIKIFISTIASSHRIYNSIGNSIDTIIVDEAGATSEMQLFPLIRLKPKNLILVGDHKQLSCFRYNNNNNSDNLSAIESVNFKINYIKSLLERMVSNNRVHHFLKIQYRMHDSISKLVSNMFYDDLLISDESCILKYEKNMEWINVDGKAISDGTSLNNRNEIDEINKIIKEHKNEKILILTFYNSQLDLLNKQLNFKKNIICKSIDSCQGMESDIVIISLVKSYVNDDFDNSFVMNLQRICVLLSRAKNKLIIVGNKKMFYKNKIWKKIIDYIDYINCANHINYT